MGVDQVPEPSVAEGWPGPGPEPPVSLPGDDPAADCLLPPDGMLPAVGATDGVSLAGLPEAERRRRLVAETARFTSAFVRWMEGRACGGLSYARLRLLQALHCG
ncbi:MAG TPA: hypothetical protein VE464_14595, partial [Streptosporangiaceae bacterium]|nr:hypothetical protein [Streptosporangiaceae bacterium]